MKQIVDAVIPLLGIPSILRVSTISISQSSSISGLIGISTAKDLFSDGFDKVGCLMIIFHWTRRSSTSRFI